MYSVSVLTQRSQMHVFMRTLISDSAEWQHPFIIRCPGPEQLYPAGWMTQKCSTQPCLQRYHLLPMHVKREDAKMLGWIPSTQQYINARAGCKSGLIIMH